MSVVENIRYSYEGFSLRVDHWEIPDVGVSVLKGPSGSGKTTLARILMGLEPLANWSWNFAGVDLSKVKPADRRLGVVFQDFALFPHLTARQNMDFAAKVRGLSSAEADELRERLVGQLDLSAILDQPARTLSGGEGQRIALARALMGKPRFLILDEPFSALDIDNRSEARQLVKNVLVEWLTPGLLITHDPTDVEVLADQVFELRKVEARDLAFQKNHRHFELIVEGKL